MRKVVVTFEVDEELGVVAEQVEEGHSLEHIFYDTNNIAEAVADEVATIVSVVVG